MHQHHGFLGIVTGGGGRSLGKLNSAYAGSSSQGEQGFFQQAGSRFHGLSFIKFIARWGEYCVGASNSSRHGDNLAHK
jgi:hypothetical protein